MGVLYLSEGEVAELVDMPSAVAVVQQAFEQLAAGHATNVPRTRARGDGIVLHSMSATADYLGLVGWKQYTTTRQGARFHVGLYDAATGEMLAVLEANRLGQLRTGAASGVAARFLVPPDAGQLGLFGAGWQAESQLEAIASTCSLERVYVYSRTPENRTDFAARMSARLEMEVVPVEQPRQAVEGMPIVVTATTSRRSVLDGSWLRPDALVCAIGSNWWDKAEIDLTTVRRSSAVVCDSIAACRGEAGDFAEALEAGVFDWSRAIELAEVVAERKSVRGEHNGIVIFKSVGLAIEDVALAGWIIQRAREVGAGREFPL